MDCIKQHPKCKAQCCKVITITLQKRVPLRPHGIIRARIPEMTQDLKRYYELHNVRVDNDTIFVRLKKYRWIGNRLIIEQRCKLLDDNLLCKGHTNGKKPKICWDFNHSLETTKGYWVPPHCLVQIGKNSPE